MQNVTEIQRQPHLNTATEQSKSNQIFNLGRMFWVNVLENMGRPDLLDPKDSKFLRQAEIAELKEYISSIYVFTPQDYSYLKGKLKYEDFEKVCISLIGGKNYNIFKMQEAGIKCPITVPLTTNFYFEAIGPKIQALIADIFQECGGEDNIYYPHHDYTSKNIKPIGELLKQKIRNVKLSDKAEAAIRQAYDAIGGYSVDKILRSAKVAEDSPNASFAGCGDSNAQFIQPTEEEDRELFRFNAIEVAASGFNFVGIENMLRMQSPDGSNFNPRRDPMAESIMRFIYPESYRSKNDEELINQVSAAYIFHDQLGFDSRKKINIQITNGTGATIADSGQGLPLVTIDKEVYSNRSDFEIIGEREVDGDNTIYFATNKKTKERVEFVRIFAPEQKTCMLINENFDYTNPESDRKKLAQIPIGTDKPAFNAKLISDLLGIVDKIDNVYPGKRMESEYAMIKDGNNQSEVITVQSRPITVEENLLVGKIPKAPEEIKEFITNGKVYAWGAISTTVFSDRELPSNTEGLGPITYYNKTISQEDAHQYGKPGVSAFMEEEITGNYTHAAVQAREKEIPCISGVGKSIVSGKRYYIFAYPNSKGEGMVIEENDSTKEYIKQLAEFHDTQVANAFDIAGNLKENPLKHFKLGINIASAKSAKKYGNNGLGIKNCTLYRPNNGLSERFDTFDFLEPKTDDRFQEVFKYLEDDVFESASQFETFNYRHCGPQLNEHFAKSDPKMQSLIKQYGDSKFSAMQGATLTCAYPKFFEEVELPMIKNVLDRLEKSKDGKNTKIKFTIEFPKSAKEVNKMLRMMESAGLHKYKNLLVGPMIENVQMALDVENIALGQFGSDQIVFSFATNDLGALTQGVDRQKVGTIETVAEASANPNPMLKIIQTTIQEIKKNFPKASISLCGEIAAALDPYVLGILYNLGVKEFAMPTNPNKFGKIFKAMHLFESRINPKTGKINLPNMVKLNLTNPELVGML